MSLVSLKRLQIEYEQYIKENSNYYIILEPENFYEWSILLFGPTDTIYEGGIFECKLIFPKTYPNNPPEFKFITYIPHPNIYKDGKVCMSILHEGEDITGYENINERWTPAHNVNSILLSFLLILVEPNIESPADIDNCILYRNNYNEYKFKIYKLIAEQHK
jgi:ubiquitin-conjugating enzyme E2 G1